MNYLLNEIAVITGGRHTGGDHLVTSALTDSRGTLPAAGALFFAIAGINHNGHDHIAELYARGARAFVVEQQVDTVPYPEAGFIRVQSSIGALQALAAHHRRAFKGTVVAITGSNGKTSVKEWIAQIVPHGMKLVRSPRSYNSQIGVPLSILMIRGDEDVALIEAGISRPGEMAALEHIVSPDIGIITTLGDAHQEHFLSLEQKLEEKLLLFKSASKILYNSRHKLIDKALHATYPHAGLIDAAGRACSIGATSVSGVSATSVREENESMVVAFYDTLGYPHEQTLARLPLLQPVAMRLEVKEGIAGSIILDDSYNADINSLSLALDQLRSLAAGRPTTLILSDILQSGLSDRELYRRVAAMVAAAGIERVVGVGAHIGRYGELFSCQRAFYPDTESLLATLDTAALAGHAVLLKGNRSSGFERIGRALELRTHTTLLEVDLDAMAANLTHLRSKLRPGTRVMAMIKALAYGHGGYEVAAMLERQGVDYLAVAFADEGIALRERGITAPIVVLNADPSSFEAMVDSRLEPEIYSPASLDRLLEVLQRRAETAYPIHVKLDTGMHRLGFVEEQLPHLIERTAASPLVRVASIFSHLAAADDPLQEAFTLDQLALFERLAGLVTHALPYPVIRHIAASAAVERYPQAQLEMVRLGIGLYGVGEGLRPVATLRTRIVQIKQLAQNQTIGYGRAGLAKRPTRIATLPIGYADGLDRRLGEGHWSVIIGGQPAPTIGRICMDTCMVDITAIDASEGDQVVIFGPEKGNRVEEMAAARGTIPYEVMTAISSRVKRIFVKE